jgi:hypothetical protein
LGDSIRRQTELLTKHAQDLGMTIVLLPPDLAVSAFHGKNRTTGELAKFVRKVHSGESNAVLLFSLRV